MALKMWPAAPDAGTVATALKRFTVKVDALLLESVTTIEVAPAGRAVGMVKDSPLKDPDGETKGEGGLIATVVPPTVTFLMVALEVKPLPLR